MGYPETRRSKIADELFGTVVQDPYRWLENDVRRDPEVARWVDVQNDLSARYVTGLAGRDVLQQRLTALFDHERLSVPEKREGRYFFTRNSGLDRQPVLMVRNDGNDRTIIDPNEWSDDGGMALAEWAPSADGTHIGYAVQKDGADWRTIRVLHVDSGAILDDEITWARFTRIAWAGDGSGFFYARSAAPEEQAAFEAPITDHSIWFHRLGTGQSDDRLIHAPEGEKPLLHWVEVTADGRYAVISSTPMTTGNSLSVIDLSKPDWSLRTIVPGFDHGWSLVGNLGGRFFLSTQEAAERGRIVTFNVDEPDANFLELIAEQDDAVLLTASIVGKRLLVSHMVDARTQVERFTLEGKTDGKVELPGIGTAGAFRGHPDDDEAFFVFSSYDSPTSIYRYDVAADASTVWARPEVAADLDRIVVEQHFYASRDGTVVPMFVVQREDARAPAPTMLTAYGGFGVPMIPFFAPEAIAWVEQGGVYAVAGVRGGGEYGDAWHRAGRLESKQNVFDDFVAAGEYLKAEGIASRDGLVIQGGSNGGLLIGAVVNQRPDLFAVALPDVGVMDMLRFNRFTGGQLWIQEFGDPSVEADFHNLLSYSPLHNIQSGVPYPAILATTADSDDRVVPGHSFKYIAALQAAHARGRPHLLRIDAKAGHGAGKSVDKVIEKTADMWAFAAHWAELAIDPLPWSEG